jgi:hypothetical protein
LSQTDDKIARLSQALTAIHILLKRYERQLGTMPNDPAPQQQVIRSYEIFREISEVVTILAMIHEGLGTLRALGERMDERRPTRPWPMGTLDPTSPEARDFDRLMATI